MYDFVALAAPNTDAKQLPSTLLYFFEGVDQQPAQTPQAQADILGPKYNLQVCFFHKKIQ